MIRFLLNILLIPVNLIGIVLMLPAIVWSLFLILLVQLGAINNGNYQMNFSWLKA